jgi:hypothetical protein
MADTPKPECAVRGLVRPGAMCARVIVGMKLCGAEPGTCPHQRDAAEDGAAKAKRERSALVRGGQIFGGNEG